ncbi:MAG: leucyl aminopeptidase [Candidatus Babeliales bacterium]
MVPVQGKKKVMIKVTYAHNYRDVSQGDMIAYCVEEGFVWNDEMRHMGSFYGASTIEQAVKQAEFTGKEGAVFCWQTLKNDKLVTIGFFGIGSLTADKSKTDIIENYRRAVARVVRCAETKKCVSVILMNHQSFGFEPAEIALQATIATVMASYRFKDYITEHEESVSVQECTIIARESDKKVVEEAIEKGYIIADAVNLSRYWVDLPPTNLNPVQLAEKAEHIAQRVDLKFTKFTEQDVINMGMGGLAAVSRGSDRDCQFVILEYTYHKDAPTVCFVGKGITFDSGGLSLKPPVHMETMKEDMAGAAAVIAAMQAIGLLKPHINVIGIAPLAENLPSGKATKPGDIITFYNGKTAEVKNTDAEGRLILADALSYAVKHYKLDALVDLATLTGACSYALGPFYSGLMGKNEALLTALEQAGDRTGDRVWRLPFSDDYKRAIKSQVADICNIGSNKYRAGAITAGFFLYNFVETTPWAHLDIAGTAFDVPDRPYYRPEGATGTGVRLIIDLVTNWQSIG